MPHQLAFTRFLNHYFAGLVNQLLGYFGVHAAHPTAPINNAVAMQVIVVALLLTFFVIVRFSLSVEKPGAAQHVAELLDGFISGQAESIIAHGAAKFVPFLSALFVYILVSNLLGLVPGMESPTGNPTVPLGLALVTFFYYHYHGIRENGAGYIKQFLGPVPVLAPLIFVIEIISHLARVLSLTIRLYANMYAGDMVTLAFFSLVPIGIPLIFLGLHIFVAGLQAFVFMLLAAIYLSLAVAHDH